MKQKKVFSLLIASGVLFFAMSCNNMAKQNQPEAKSNMQQVDTINMAVCVLHPTEGNSTEGTVTFSTSGSGVKVVADLKGLTPGKHGFHIHQYGDCSALDGTSAGGHFNPENIEHGGPNADVRHVGDLGNIEADADGNAHYESLDNMISLNGMHSIIGRAIIVHAGEDDLTSQPTGAAGARVACGVIGIAK
jgi:Cu-Zn family superoxide dismutase